MHAGIFPFLFEGIGAIGVEQDAMWVERWVMLSGGAWCDFGWGSGVGKEWEAEILSLLHFTHMLHSRQFNLRVSFTGWDLCGRATVDLDEGV